MRDTETQQMNETNSCKNNKKLKNKRTKKGNVDSSTYNNDLKNAKSNRKQ